MENVKKMFNCSNMDLLLTANTIAENFKDNIDELSEANDNWNGTYADDLKARIDNAIRNHIGVNPRKDLRNATLNLNKLIADVKNDLSSFKVSVRSFYHEQPDKIEEIFNNLGVKHYFRKSTSKSQGNFIKMLCTFRTNMTDDYRKEFKTIGIKDSIIDNIINKAGAIEAANVLQEKLKGVAIIIASDNIALYNSIFTEIIGISKIAAAFYRKNPAKKNLFTFTKIARIVRSTKKLDDFNQNDDVSLASEDSLPTETE